VVERVGWTWEQRKAYRNSVTNPRRQRLLGVEERENFERAILRLVFENNRLKGKKLLKLPSIVFIVWSGFVFTIYDTVKLISLLCPF